MTLFERVKETAKKRGWSLQETAQKAGLGINSIYAWKNKTPSVDRIKSVADVLGVTVDYLLGETEKPSVSKPKQVDLDDDEVIMTFEGRPIPPEDVELMRRLLRGSRDGK
jgi:transcriptional regulator with XRE-family HTH domain